MTPPIKTLLTTTHMNKRRFLGRALTAAALILSSAATGASTLSQNAMIASDIQARLTPSPHAPELHKTVTMKVPTTNGGFETLTVDYGHSVDLAVYFPYDSATITPQAAALLTELGRALQSRKLRDRRFLIAGHTDARGDADYNLALSHRRARAVTLYLAQTFGLHAQRLVPVGFGETRPGNPAWPEDPLNRRVEITLIVG